MDCPLEHEYGLSSASIFLSSFIFMRILTDKHLHSAVMVTWQEHIKKFKAFALPVFKCIFNYPDCISFLLLLPQIIKNLAYNNTNSWFYSSPGQNIAMDLKGLN